MSDPRARSGIGVGPGLRILVMRLSAMGDVIHALPAVAALRTAHPEAEIGWAVEPAWAPLLSAGPARARGLERGLEQPIVDRVHLVPFKRWARNPLSSRTRSEFLAVRRELRAHNYDVCVDLQGSLRSAWLARMTGVPRIVGEAIPREKPARFLFTERVETRGVHVIEQDLELCAAIYGDRELAYESPAYPMVPEEESWAENIVRGQPTALLLPGAGWGSKRWPPERFSAVAAGLAERGVQCLVNAGPGEEALANAVSEASGGEAAIVQPSLLQLIALLRRICLLVGGDTGPLHLASTLRVPTVGIYGPTDPARNGPFATRFEVLRHPESERNHARRKAPEAGLLTITPEDVLHACDTLLTEAVCA